MGLTTYAFIITLVLISEHIGVSNGENLPNPDGPGGYIIPCGSVTCNVTIEYCESDVTGDSECLQCEGMCLRARVGTNERYIEECLEICPVYWQLQLGEEARHDAKNIITTTHRAPKCTTEPWSDNKMILGLSIGLALCVGLIIALLFVVWAFIVRPRTKKAPSMSNEIENGGNRNNVPRQQQENGAPERQSLLENGHESRHGLVDVAKRDDTGTTIPTIHPFSDRENDATSPKRPIGSTVTAQTEAPDKIPRKAPMSTTGGRSVPRQTDTPVPSPTNDGVPERTVCQPSDADNDNMDTIKLVSSAGHSIVEQPPHCNGSVREDRSAGSRTRTPKIKISNQTKALSDQTQLKVV